VGDSSFVILVDVQQRRGRRFEEAVQDVPSLKTKIVATKSLSDITSVISAIMDRSRKRHVLF
jgi:hypothetical protein